MPVGPNHDLQAALAAQGAPKSQTDRIGLLCALFQQSPACLAAALVGLYARGSGDRIADLDLVVFVEEHGAERFIDEAHALLATADVLDEYFGVHDGLGCFRKYVYLDFTSCEIHAFTVPTAFELHRPFVAVWDPAGFLGSVVVEGPPPRHEDFDAYAHGDAGLVWELVDCVKWLKRGRRRLAKNHLRKLVAALDRQEPSDPGNATRPVSPPLQGEG